MNHYTLEQWADFARKVAKPETATAMERHLKDGCGACAESKALMQRVADMATKEAEYEPPTELVRSAKAQLLGTQPSPLRTRIAETVELVFDSFMQPALAGVRAGSSTTRQLLYQKDNCSIDIRLEDSAPNQLNVIGQVLRSADSETSVGAVLVEALRDGKSVGSTSTNSHGEFHLSLATPGALELCFGFSSKHCLLVRVPPMESIPQPGKVVSE